MIEVVRAMRIINAPSVSEDVQAAFEVRFNAAEDVVWLRHLLRRALNTWEPADRPPWALFLADEVEQEIERYAKT